jgi:CubicO group peptidase (beta-lactamase class C family)
VVHATAARLDAVGYDLEAIVAEGRIRSAAVAVRIAGREVLHHHAGDGDRPYDLASLTKPLAGATVAAALVERGALSLDAPLTRVHPALTIGHLLDHSGGFPAWEPLHQEVDEALWGTERARAAIVAAACRRCVGTPGEREVYSDLGLLTLLSVVEEAGGARLDELLAPWLARAGVDLRWGWPGAAPTQWGRAGVVHDPLAYAMGGVSSHAGLFGRASDVAAFAEALVDARIGRRSDLPGRSLDLRRGPGSHQAGWDTPPGTRCTGARWPAEALGHVGYTGTSVWVAPRERVTVALLTNRVHPDDEKTAIREARPRIHDAVARALGW